MMPGAITLLLFKEAFETFPTSDGELSCDDPFATQETLMPPLMVLIPYNLLLGIHSLRGILVDLAKYNCSSRLLGMQLVMTLPSTVSPFFQMKHGIGPNFV